MSARPVDSTDTVSIEALRTENQALRVENQLLKDEIARLKGLPLRPPAKPRQSSGMETATDPSGSKRRHWRKTRGAKRDRDRVTRDVILTVEVPEGSRFKGYETLLVRDLALSAEVLRYRRERWVTPAGESIVAPVPTGTVGGYGANLRRFCLVLHAQGQVTTERLTAILNGIGVEISKRQVVRLLTANLETFVEEDAGAPRDPASYQRVGERHPRLCDQAKDLRRHDERGWTRCPGRDARPDEDLQEARRIVLCLSGRPFGPKPQQSNNPAARPLGQCPRLIPPGNLPRLPTFPRKSLISLKLHCGRPRGSSRLLRSAATEARPRGGRGATWRRSRTSCDEAAPSIWFSCSLRALGAVRRHGGREHEG